MPSCNPPSVCMERDSALLFDILESARLILEWTQRMDAAEFLADHRPIAPLTPARPRG